MPNIIMADIAGLVAKKDVFDVDEDRITTATGGNTKNFSDLYMDVSEPGFYIYDVEDNPTTNDYVRFAYFDNRTGYDLKGFVRRPTNYAPATPSTNYNFYLAAGAKVIRYFIPESAFS